MDAAISEGLVLPWQHFPRLPLHRCRCLPPEAGGCSDGFAGLSVFFQISFKKCFLSQCFLKISQNTLSYCHIDMMYSNKISYTVYINRHSEDRSDDVSS